MNIEYPGNHINVGLDPLLLNKLFQDVFLSLEEMLKAKDEQNPNLDEISQLLNNLFPLVEAFKTQKHEFYRESEVKIYLNYNKSLLISLFYLIGKEEDNTQTQLLVRLLLIMMSKDSYLISPFSWENLFSIIEEEIVTGSNTSETFRAFSRIFYLLPSNALKRLFGDFFDYIKTLLDSFLEDPSSLLPSLFQDIINFLISTKLNIYFQQKLAKDEVHLILYKILKSLFELDQVDHALSFIQENRELLIQIIVNCLSVADMKLIENFNQNLFFDPISCQLEKFENEILGPLLYTNSVTDVIPLIVNFKDENYLFENFDEKLDLSKFIDGQPNYTYKDLFRKSLNQNSSSITSFYWKTLNKISINPTKLQEADRVMIEMSLLVDNTPTKFIALITSGFYQVNGQIKTNQTTGNYLFKYENQELYLLSDEINLLILNFHYNYFQLKIFCHHLKILEINMKNIKVLEVLFESSSILKKEVLEELKQAQITYYSHNDCTTDIWATFNVVNANRFDKNVLSQFESFFSQKKNSLFLLPSKLTLEEFLLILVSKNPEHISSLRIFLNEERVGMHTKLEDLIHKEKSNYLEITIRTIDGIVDTIPLLSPEEVFQTALAKISYQPWTLISRCSYLFQGNIIFPTLAQMTSSVFDKKEDLSVGYKTLAKEFGVLIGPLESLFGVRLYNLFFWFMFDSKSIKQKLRLVWQTILHAIWKNDLNTMEPNEIEILIDNYMKSNIDPLANEYVTAKLNLEYIYKLGLMQVKSFINPLIEGLIWKNEILSQNNHYLRGKLQWD